MAPESGHDLANGWATMPDICAECRHLNQRSTGKSHDQGHNDQNCGRGADGTRKGQDSHGRQVDFDAALASQKAESGPALQGRQ